MLLRDLFVRRCLGQDIVEQSSSMQLASQTTTSLIEQSAILDPNHVCYPANHCYGILMTSELIQARSKQLNKASHRNEGSEIG